MKAEKDLPQARMLLQPSAGGCNQLRYRVEATLRKQVADLRVASTVEGDPVPLLNCRSQGVTSDRAKHTIPAKSRRLAGDAPSSSTSKPRTAPLVVNCTAASPCVISPCRPLGVFTGERILSVADEPTQFCRIGYLRKACLNDAHFVGG